MKNIVESFRLISTLEAISLLVLFFIAMPLKYAFDLPLMVKYVGWAHGVLFIVYVVAAVMVKEVLNWSMKTLILCVIASLIPFGPFYFEKKYLPKKN